MTSPPVRFTPAPISPPIPGILLAREPIVFRAFPTPVSFFPARAFPRAVAAKLEKPSSFPDVKSVPIFLNNFEKSIIFYLYKGNEISANHNYKGKYNYH